MRFIFVLIMMFVTMGSARAQEHWFGSTTLEDIQTRPRVSLVFASQDEVHPLSYFGHTFLVFHREPLPEIDAPIVEFLGQTEGIDGWAWKALVTSIPGRYQLQRFLYKARAYELENRDLWIYTFSQTDSEREALIRNLEEALSTAYPYQFTSKNCGAYIEALLPMAPSKSLFTLPMNSVQNPEFTARVTKVQVVLAQRTQGRLTQDPADLLRYQFAREADPDKRQAIFAQLKNTPGTLQQVKTDDPARFSGRRRLGVQWVSPTEQHLLLAPYAQDFYTAGAEVPAGSVLRILQGDIAMDSDGLRWDALDLFHLEAMTAKDAWSDSHVRHLEFAYQRALPMNRKPGWLLRWGTGYAWAPWKGFLLGVKGLLDLNISESIQNDLGARLYLEHKINSRLRLSWEYHQSVLPQLDFWSQTTARVSYTLASRWILEADGNRSHQRAGLILNF
ncbi:MAG TPA: DUF4105 domain-containing protein [Oligoflexus sp.]|uniref:lipoprotein N-acyltransferase Lnb domain-containing protein n=1 Tax=Oligoflexus sp. TaxID=1971216 RepID=UPI002D3B0944|nr:DUF4105 domain-containing protein [Oligoflexus sp.]HYX35011.1 DUF4105 domain-containing protein [Oligoflexus sp.]